MTPFAFDDFIAHANKIYIMNLCVNPFLSSFSSASQISVILGISFDRFKSLDFQDMSYDALNDSTMKLFSQFRHHTSYSFIAVQ